VAVVNIKSFILVEVILMQTATNDFMGKTRGIALDYSQTIPANQDSIGFNIAVNILLEIMIHLKVLAATLFN
jgi:hypothetical protein